MAIDFPNSPTTGQLFQAGGNSWTYTGSYWEATADNPLPKVLTTTGDMIRASAAYTPERFGIGTTGYPLVAGASLPAYAQLGTVGIADGAVSEVKMTQTGFSVTKTSQVISAGNNDYVTFTAEQYDSDGYWPDFYGNNFYVNILAGMTGMYILSLTTTATAPANFYASIYSSGGSAGTLLRDQFSNGSSVVAGSVVASLADSSNLTVGVFNNTGGSITVTTTFRGVRVLT